jgi:RNA polymerase sigma-70 factor (ECF subfamily)
MIRSNETPDATLVAEIASRDPEALGALYDRHRSVVFTLALRMLGDRAQAEEILQEVFLQAWSLAPGYGRAPGSVPGWLMHLCRMRCLERIRGQAAVSPPGRPPGRPPARPAADGSEIPDSLRDKRRRIRELLSLLPGEQREAIEAAYYGDLLRRDPIAGEERRRLQDGFARGVMALRVNMSASLAGAGSGEEAP